MGRGGPDADQIHRVIRIDLLGHGRSAKPADRSYALPDQARRAGAAMDRLGVERVIVAGQSSGGAATALAEQRPDLMAALVLINTGPHLGAYIAPPAAIDPLQWPDVTDEQLRQFASSWSSRPGYQIPLELLNEVRAMTFHSLTTTTQASRDYVKEQALPDRLAPLGKPLLVISVKKTADGDPHPPRTTARFPARGSKCCPASGIYHTRGSGADRLLPAGLHRDPGRAGGLNETEAATSPTAST